MAGQCADRHVAKRWMRRFARILSRRPVVARYLPLMLGCYAKVLWAECRWAPALAVLRTALSLLPEKSTSPVDIAARRQLPLMMAWCSVQLEDGVTAAKYLRIADGPALSSCWADIRKATCAEMFLYRGTPKLAAELLATADVSAEDVGAMYVAIAQVKTDHALGRNWRETARQALVRAAETRQAWAIAPVRLLLNADQAEKGERQIALE